MFRKENTKSKGADLYPIFNLDSDPNKPETAAPAVERVMARGEIFVLAANIYRRSKNNRVRSRAAGII